MELPRRRGEDVYLPDGSLRQALTDLRRLRETGDVSIAIVYAFDYRTRMLRAE